MEVVYPILLIIHLFCAIIFLGYIFCDVVLLGLVRKHLGDAWADKTWSVVSPRARKIMPICLFVLVITGFGMVTRYIKFSQGYEAFFGSNLQTLLTIKMILALSIFVVAFSSIFCVFVLKKQTFISKYVHKIAFVLGIFVVLLAKLAFIL